MKSLWNIVSFLAVVHLLALLMFVGWLWNTQRLSRDRVEAVRELFTKTVPQQMTEEKDAATAATIELARLEQEAKERRPPITSAAQIEAVSRVQEREAQAARRLIDDQRQLIAQIDIKSAELDARVAQQVAREQLWDQQVGREQERKIDEQFRKTVAQYEALPPKQGKQMLQALVSGGDQAQAVAYLDAMDERAAKKILSEFKTPDEVTLATELLEKLRMFGTPAELTPEPSPDAPAAVSPAQRAAAKP
jgi:hypothetical protein